MQPQGYGKQEKRKKFEKNINWLQNKLIRTAGKQNNQRLGESTMWAIENNKVKIKDCDASSKFLRREMNLAPAQLEKTSTQKRIRKLKIR